MISMTSGRFLFAKALVVLGAALAARSAWAQQSRQYTEISGSGRTLYRIAVAPAIDKGGAAKPARSATAVMTRDLTLCGLFRVLNPKGFLANLEKEGVGIDPQAWLDVGAQGVIKARVQRLSGGFSIDFFLYDTTKGIRPVLARSYKNQGASIRRLAHRFGDEVVRYFTDERGIFNTRIAFSRVGRRRGSQIYVMDYDGHGAHKVSRTGKHNILPSWSPAGKLTYTAFLWRNPDLYIQHALGKRAHRISKRPGLNSGAAWSPNGKRIALTLSKDGNPEIYLITPRGRIIRRLTHEPAIDTSPTWSPDGRHIAFVSDRGGSPQIYVMNASGGGVRRLTFQGNYNQEPAWCPRKATPLVAFTGRDEKGKYDLFTVNVKSGELKRLTQGQGSNTSPSWAPNGLVLSFVSSRGGIWLMDPDGLNQQQIYRGRAATPAWSW